MTTTTPHGLGRRVQHDERSRAYRTRFAGTPVKTRTHRHYGPPLDQGELGSCTGNAAAQLLNTAPFHTKAEPLFTETDAVLFYSEATALDDYEGSYPPEDTGSSGLAVAQALLQRKLIVRYEHAFGLQEALETLASVPVITGVPWYEQMFDPDPHSGEVSIGGNVAGGHEFLVYGVDAKRRLVLALNSWGTSWGKDGKFCMTWDTWDRLLSEDGDVTLLYRS